MSRLTYWYSGLSRGAKTGITIGGIALAVIAAIAILYLVLAPEKVEVRYGTIVWDPIDGHVWEDNTETIWVEASEAGDYRVERVVQYSPEHQEQIDKQQAELAQQQQAQEGSAGYEALQTVMPTDTLEDLNALQQDLDTMSQDVISGLEMANEISQTRSALQAHYDQIAAYEVIPQIEQYKQQYLSAISKYIQACDLVLKGIATADQSCITQAQVLYDEGTAIIQSLGATLQQLIPAQ
jgi:hypothetical protein